MSEALPMNNIKINRCLGFGQFENKCDAAVVSPALLWCPRCDALRRDHISAQLNTLANAMCIPPLKPLKVEPHS